ncbi:MAG TPA: hypothetical protein VD970_09760 [Acetobacteraceae bacterium]|nr:hypothetical protein [Acetobacteraceae bacterium]
MQMRRALRLLPTVALAALPVLVFVAPSHACMPPLGAPHERLPARSSTIITGTVIEVRDSGHTARIAATERWRGHADETLLITSPRFATCSGRRFTIGERVTVFFEHGPRYTVSQFSIAGDPVPGSPLHEALSRIRQ